MTFSDTDLDYLMTIVAEAAALEIMPRIRSRFSANGGVELDLPSRQEKATAVDFSE